MHVNAKHTYVFMLLITYKMQLIFLWCCTDMCIRQITHKCLFVLVCIQKLQVFYFCFWQGKLSWVYFENVLWTDLFLEWKFFHCCYLKKRLVRSAFNRQCVYNYVQTIRLFSVISKQLHLGDDFWKKKVFYKPQNGYIKF